MFLGAIVSTSIVMFVCFTITYLLLFFFLIYLFVTAAKAALPKIVLKKLSGLGSETSNQ